MSPQGADVVIAEMRLVPTARADETVSTVVPPGGMPARSARDAIPGTALRLFKERLAASLTPGSARYKLGQRLTELGGAC